MYKAIVGWKVFVFKIEKFSSNKILGLNMLGKENSIHRTLKALSRQRVAMIIQSGNILVVEKCLPKSEENMENLQTCLLRGWVEVLHDSIPSGSLNEDGSLPKDHLFTSEENVFRITDSGWNAINRTYQLTLLSIFIAIVALIGIL